MGRKGLCHNNVNITGNLGLGGRPGRGVSRSNQKLGRSGTTIREVPPALNRSRARTGGRKRQREGMGEGKRTIARAHCQLPQGCDTSEGAEEVKGGAPKSYVKDARVKRNYGLEKGLIALETARFCRF